MTHCGCKVKIEKNLSGYMKIPEIVYCPLHLAAPELLAMLKRFREYLDNGIQWDRYYLNIKESNHLTDEVIELIAKATPRKDTK